MAAVDVVNMVVLENPAPFTAPLQFEITYDVREPLAEDLEWKVIYVGSAEDPAHDQELDAVLLPADTPGRFAFVLAVDAPDVAAIPPADVVGVTIVLVTASYHGTEFVRVGYYVNNELVGADADAGGGGGEAAGGGADTTAATDNAAASSVDGVAPSGATAVAVTAGPVDVSKLVRNIAADEPRITKIPHKFDWGGTDAGRGGGGGGATPLHTVGERARRCRGGGGGGRTASSGGGSSGRSTHHDGGGGRDGGPAGGRGGGGGRGGCFVRCGHTGGCAGEESVARGGRREGGMVGFSSGTDLGGARNARKRNRRCPRGAHTHVATQTLPLTLHPGAR